MIFALKLDRDEEAQRYKHLAPLLTVHRRQQIQRYRREADRVRSAFAGVLSRYAVTMFSGQDLNGMTIGFSENGKSDIVYRRPTSSAKSPSSERDLDKEIEVGLQRIPHGIFDVSSVAGVGNEPTQRGTSLLLTMRE